MDEVAELVEALLARCAADGAPGPGDGFVLTRVPEGPSAAGEGSRWELLVTRGGCVVGRAVAAQAADALRTALDRAAPGPAATPGPAAAAGHPADPPADAGHGEGTGVLLRALERVADAVPLVLDVDAAGDLAPGTGAHGWAWTVTATRWDVLLEGSVLRWGGARAQEVLARALADLDDGPAAPAPGHDPLSG